MSLDEPLRQPVVQELGWTLVHFLWEGGIIAGIFALAQVGLRKHSANVRYLSACVALLVMVVAPVLTFSLLYKQAPPIKRSPAIPAPAPVPAHGVPEASPQISFGSQADVSPLGDAGVVNFDAVLPWLVCLWMLGVLLLSCRLLIGSVQVWRLKRWRNEPLGAPYFQALKKLQAALRVNRSVRLVKSAMVAVPTVIGWLRPVILFPAGCMVGLAPAQLEAILAHELAHIRRHDYLVNLVQNAVETLLFYHPAAWWISHRIRVERENCCDDVAVKVCGDRLNYARALATLEELRSAPVRLVIAADGGSLLARIQRLYGLPTNISPLNWRKVGGALATTVVSLIVALILTDGLTLVAIGKASRTGALTKQRTAPISKTIEVTNGATVEFEVTRRASGPIRAATQMERAEREKPLYIVEFGANALVGLTTLPASNPVSIAFARWKRDVDHLLPVFRLTNGESGSILLWNVRVQIPSARESPQASGAAGIHAGWETIQSDYPTGDVGILEPGASGEFWVASPPKGSPWRVCILYSKERFEGERRPPEKRLHYGNYEVISATLPTIEGEQKVAGFAALPIGDELLIRFESDAIYDLRIVRSTNGKGAFLYFDQEVRNGQVRHSPNRPEANLTGLHQSEMDGLDKLLRFYRSNPHQIGCLTENKITIKQRHDGQIIATEQFTDKSCYHGLEKGIMTLESYLSLFLKTVSSVNPQKQLTTRSVAPGTVARSGRPSAVSLGFFPGWRGFPILPSGPVAGAVDATTRAVMAANNAARRDYGVEPFADTNGTATFDGHRWSWRKRLGRGKGDFEAEVIIAPSGIVENATVQYLTQ